MPQLGSEPRTAARHAVHAPCVSSQTLCLPTLSPPADMASELLGKERVAELRQREQAGTTRGSFGAWAAQAALVAARLRASLPACLLLGRVPLSMPPSFSTMPACPLTPMPPPPPPPPPHPHPPTHSADRWQRGRAGRAGGGVCAVHQVGQLAAAIHRGGRVGAGQAVRSMHLSSANTARAFVSGWADGRSGWAGAGHPATPAQHQPVRCPSACPQPPSPPAHLAPVPPQRINPLLHRYSAVVGDVLLLKSLGTARLQVTLLSAGSQVRGGGCGPEQHGF